MTKARILADLISDNAELADGTISVAEVVGAAPLASPDFTGGIDITGGFTATDGSTITTADNTTQLSLISTDTDANTGPVLALWRNSGSPAGNDVTGKIAFQGEDAGGNKTTYSNIETSISDTTEGSEDGKIDIRSILAGTEISRIEMGRLETVINEDSKDLDFRVESDANANALFVDAGNNNVIFGNSTIDASGSFGYKLSTNDIRHVRPSGAAGDTLFAAVSGVSNGFQISDDTSNNRTYKFHNAGSQSFFLGMTEAAFNEGSLDRDFRVESDSNANMLFVDGGNNRVGIGQGAPRSGLVLDVSGDIGQTWDDGEKFIGQQYSTGSYRMGLITDSSDRTAQLVANAGDSTGKLEFYTNSNRAGLVSSSNDWTFFEGVTINENGNDNDFRVESNNNANMFFLDAGNDRLLIGTATAIDVPFVQIAAAKNYSNAIPRNMLSITDLNAYNSTDNGGAITFQGEYSGGSFTSFASVEGNKYNNTAGDYSGKMRLATRRSGGVNEPRLDLSLVEAVFNEDSKDCNFRVESDSSTVMLFVDAGNNALGINNGSPSSYPANSFTGTATDGGLLRIGGNVGAVCVSGTGNEIAFTRNSANYIGAFGGAADIRIRAGTSGGVSLGNTATSWSSLSDERLKTITGNIENASDKVKTLRTVIGRYNDESETTSHAFLIAQDVQLVLPQAVSVLTQDEALESDGIQNKLQLSYTEVIPLLTAALKEAITKIETLEARITALENA